MATLHKYCKKNMQLGTLPRGNKTRRITCIHNHNLSVQASPVFAESWYVSRLFNGSARQKKHRHHKADARRSLRKAAFSKIIKEQHGKLVIAICHYSTVPSVQPCTCTETQWMCWVARHFLSRSCRTQQACTVKQRSTSQHTNAPVDITEHISKHVLTRPVQASAQSLQFGGSTAGRGLNASELDSLIGRKIVKSYSKYTRWLHVTCPRVAHIRARFASFQANRSGPTFILYSCIHTVA